MAQDIQIRYFWSCLFGWY